MQDPFDGATASDTIYVTQEMVVAHSVRPEPHPGRVRAWDTVQRLRARARREDGTDADGYTDIDSLRERVQFLRQLGEQGRMNALRDAIEIELFLVQEDVWQTELFLQSLRIRLSKPGCDSIKIARMRQHADCARFGDLARIFRSFDLIQLASELRTLDFFGAVAEHR